MSDDAAGLGGSVELRHDDDRQAIVDAVERFCADRCGEQVVKAVAGSFPRALWKELADLGFLALATPEGGGGAREIVALVEPLGRALFPGPLAETFLATAVLEGDERAAVAAGESIVSAGTPPLMPFATEADVFLAIEGDAVVRTRPLGRGAIEPVPTLGGEPWGRVELEPGSAIGPGPAVRGRALHDVALAAYLAAAGTALVAAAAEHARVRKQFGRPIGSFQAVAHPLAECHLRLGTATGLARVAAGLIDASEDGTVSADARRRAAGARLSAATHAVAAAHACHQVFGGIGITLEGPAFHASRRIRQLASAAPGPGPAREAVLAPLLGEMFIRRNCDRGRSRKP